LATIDRVRFRVCVEVYKCLHNMAPGYLSTLCQSVSSVPGRRHLRSARRGAYDWTFHVSIWLRRGDGRLPMPVPHLGTLYLTLSRTLILLCKPSNAILRLSFFLHTSTFSAFEVSYKIALYKSTVIIIIINRHGPKSGAAVSLSWGELGPHLMQCRLGRGLPPHQVVS